jgi:hypothetical protein
VPGSGADLNGDIPCGRFSVKIASYSLRMVQMPLTATDNKAVAHADRIAVGVWMQNDSGSLFRAFVTYEALWQSDPSQVRDVHSALLIFNAKRVHFESLASARYDAIGTNEGAHEGRPFIILRSDDI